MAILPNQPGDPSSSEQNEFDIAASFSQIKNAFCPHCECDRDIEFKGMIVELGNIPRFECKVCGGTHELIF